METVTVSTRDKASRPLFAILAVAFVVSVVHYIDNYVNYADYPQPGPHELPAPPASAIAASWFVFTAIGLLGVRWWLRGHVVRAACALAGYAFSGLIGIAHYTVHGATAMPWWRQTHVLLDILCGLAVLGFALWAVITRPGSAGSRADPQPRPRAMGSHSRSTRNKMLGGLR